MLTYDSQEEQLFSHSLATVAAQIAILFMAIVNYKIDLSSITSTRCASGHFPFDMPLLDTRDRCST